MKKENLIPFDIPNVELGRHGDECTFDAIIKKIRTRQKESRITKSAKIEE